MFKNVQNISNLVKTNLRELMKLGKPRVKKIMPFRNEQLDSSWKVELLKELILCREGNLNNNLSLEQNKFLIDNLCTN